MSRIKAYRLRRARLKMWKEGLACAKLIAYGMSRAEWKATLAGRN